MTISAVIMDDARGDPSASSVARTGYRGTQVLADGVFARLLAYEFAVRVVAGRCDKARGPERKAWLVGASRAFVAAADPSLESSPCMSGYSPPDVILRSIVQFVLYRASSTLARSRVPAASCLGLADEGESKDEEVPFESAPSLKGKRAAIAPVLGLIAPLKDEPDGMVGSESKAEALATACVPARRENNLL
ncbi:uncharacterized protein THITE_2126144 [Thermothielavioides terrestris NRRL 8126]|uniref:Uncharacterized protein n=1 Tax=Thermothielavioides terrestris (strain ATCC 38088 / NRRL 8126) TaxID=578455 RepID=G2QUC0_THETT|nr:uncharacterized protein THITE_2126144 [Thermothielavioides terrestris NRRL 8126]AEO63672.1 hypothetical protein THITE_2126144 [Thermothielavioides terrestris NRRL 8126]